MFCTNINTTRLIITNHTCGFINNVTLCIWKLLNNITWLNVIQRFFLFCFLQCLLYYTQWFFFFFFEIFIENYNNYMPTHLKLTQSFCLKNRKHTHTQKTLQLLFNSPHYIHTMPAKTCTRICKSVNISRIWNVYRGICRIPLPAC